MELSTPSLIQTFEWINLALLLIRVDPPLSHTHRYLILGKTKMTIFRAYFNGAKYKLIELPKNLGKHWQEITNTEIDEINKKIKLDGMVNKGQENYWVEWEFNYESCEIEWNSHVTLSDWQKGITNSAHEEKRRRKGNNRYDRISTRFS